MRILLTVGCMLTMAAPSSAAVLTTTDSSFIVERTLDVAASPMAIWAAIGDPAKWWVKEHSWSGDASNLSMALVAGGCFCEKLADGGSVEHARVVTVMPGKLLRLSGALGPMQRDAVTGTFDYAIAPTATGAVLTVRYSVAGAFGMPPAKLAPMVDAVLGDQAEHLKAYAERH